MGNSIKYTTGSESNSLAKGNFRIGTGDVGKGASSVTGFYKATEPPSGGYRVYLYNDGLSGDIAYYSATNDSELISFTNNLAGTSYTTVQECLGYYDSQTDKVCFNREYEPIVTNGLVFNVDAGFVPSYPQSGVTWDDLSGNGYNGTLINGPTYSSSNGGSIVFDGVDDIASFGTSLNLNYENFTVGIWAKSPTNTSGASGFPIHVTNLVGKGNWNANNSWRIGYKSSGGLPATTITFSYGIGWTLGPEISVNSFNLSVYNYFVGVATPTQQLLYLNGRLVASVNITKVNVSNTENFEIARSSYISRFFKGDIPMSHIYNRSLTSSEIVQNYQAMLPRILGENIVTSGLVFYLDAGYTASYPGSGTTWSNISGIGTNATLVNGPSFNNQDGGSIVFDGLDDYASCNFTIGTGDFTFSVWMKKTTNVSNLEFVMGRYSDQVARGAMLFFNGGTLRFRLGGSPSGQFVESNLGNVTDGTWKNITCSVTRTGNMVSYINGIPLVTTNASTQQGSISNSTIIGSLFGTGWFLSGNLATVSTYNKALSATEILQNYNAQKARFGL